MKIDLKKSDGDFSSVNTFPPKQTILLLDLSVLLRPNLKTRNNGLEGRQLVMPPIERPVEPLLRLDLSRL
jgi:hypothetical protein